MLPYPPPFQDLRTLAAHTCLSESTIEGLVKAGRFPQPRRGKCGKRLWYWPEVESYLAAPDDDGRGQGEIYEATRRFRARHA